MDVLEEEESPAIQFRLTDVADNELYLADVASGPALREGLQVRLTGTHRVTPEQNLFTLVLTVTYTQPTGDDQAKTLLRYTNSTTLEIINFEQVIKPIEQEQFSVPDQLLEAATGLAISTMRGILIEKTANTRFRGLYLPIVNPKLVVEQLFGDG